MHKVGAQRVRVGRVEAQRVRVERVGAWDIDAQSGGREGGTESVEAEGYDIHARNGDTEDGEYGMLAGCTGWGHRRWGNMG